MIDSLRRFDDDEVPIDRREVADLRDFFAGWARELRSNAD